MIDLEKKIESFLKKLEFLILNRKLTDIKVVACSQELDKLGEVCNLIANLQREISRQLSKNNPMIHIICLHMVM